MVVSYANFLTNTELSKITAAYRQILLVKKKTPNTRQIYLKKDRPCIDMFPYRNFGVAKEAPQSSYTDGATNSSSETISALLYEKAFGHCNCHNLCHYALFCGLQSVVMVS